MPIIQGLSVANGRKLDGDFVDASDRRSPRDVGGTYVTLVGLAGRQFVPAGVRTRRLTGTS